MPSIKAILFDLDGTLRDTREVIYPALEHALKTHLGNTPTRTEMLPHIHYHRAVHEAFAPDIPYDEFMLTYRDKLTELRPTTVAYEGSNTVVQKLHEKGYMLGIVTSGTSAADYLAGQGIAGHFEVIVGGEDVTEHKPSPVPIMTALNALHVDPQDAVMIGDLQVDILAAKAAGLRAAIGIKHGFGNHDMLAGAGADYILDSFDELEAIIEKIEAA